MPMLFRREAKISSSEHMRIGGSEEMAWLQICEPTEKDKGKYTFEIFDGKDNHQRSLDLSGQGTRTTHVGTGEQRARGNPPSVMPFT